MLAEWEELEDFHNALDDAERESDGITEALVNAAAKKDDGELKLILDLLGYEDLDDISEVKIFKEPDDILGWKWRAFVL